MLHSVAKRVNSCCLTAGSWCYTLAQSPSPGHPLRMTAYGWRSPSRSSLFLPLPTVFESTLLEIWGRGDRTPRSPPLNPQPPPPPSTILHIEFDRSDNTADISVLNIVLCSLVRCTKEFVYKICSRAQKGCQLRD